MSKLRNAARGKPCMVRLTGCTGGGDTTVLAHYRMAGYSGVGMKPDDLAFGAWACLNCHDLVDGRRREPGLSRQDLRLAHAEAVMRTIAEISRQ